MKVWLIDIGSFDDRNQAYGGVFSSKEKAQIFLDQQEENSKGNASAYTPLDFKYAEIYSLEVQ